jgi:hypothetical protein
MQHQEFDLSRNEYKPVACTGVAKIEVSETGEILEISPDKLEWETEPGDERSMGAELIHYATFEGDSENGYGVKVTWQINEYPVGQVENAQVLEIDGGERLKDFDSFSVRTYDDYDELAEMAEEAKEIEKWEQSLDTTEPHQNPSQTLDRKSSEDIEDF